MIAKLATIKNAAVMIDMTEGALRKLITRRHLPPGVVLRFGGRAIRLDVEALIAWARSTSVPVVENLGETRT